MQPWAKWFYDSKEWKKCRKAYAISQNGICERCKRKGRIVHHKIYLTKDNINNPLITLNPDNLEYLCQDCHTKEHLKKFNNKADGLTFDGEGNLIQVPPTIKK